MGMPVRIVAWTDARAAAETAIAAAFDRIATLDARMSDYRPESEVRRLSSLAGTWTRISPELHAVLARAKDIARVTDGAFDPTIGPLTSLWRDARGRQQAPSAAALARARALVGWRDLQLDPERNTARLAKPGMALDVGGIAKGYILQEARDLLVDRGCPRVLLEAGGDIVVGAPPPDKSGWRIDVGGTGPVADRARSLTFAALATSGASSQFVAADGVHYSHVIDPLTGLGVTHDRVVHVIATDAAIADGLATALGVLAPARAAAVMTRFPEVLWQAK